MPIRSEIITIERPILCKFCGNADLWQNGEHNGVPYYLCKVCGHRANGKDTFPHQKYEKDIISKALTFYYNGMSFAGVRNTFDDEFGIRPSTSTLWEWIMKYTKLVVEYTNELIPTDIGDEWFADETMIKLHGKDKWLWAVLDGKTRYLLGCNFTYTRPIRSAEKLFQEAYYHAGKAPKTLRTDGLPAYIKAFKNVITTRNMNAVHLTSKGFGSKSNTNLIERWNEYVKQRTKIMRYFKNPASAFIIAQGIIVNYNFLWEHSGIGDIPPAQKAGINIGGLGIKNWGNLIELALKEETNKNPSSQVGVWYFDELERLKNRSELLSNKE